MSLKQLAYVVPFLVAAGCGSKLTPFDPGTGGDFATNDDSGMGGGGGDMGGPVAVIDMAGFNVAGSPVVTITAPAAGAEVAGDKLTVTATITSPTSTLLAAGSVQI